MLAGQGGAGGDEVGGRTLEHDAPDVVAGLRREAHTPLQLITDAEYAVGLARLRQAARTSSGPVIDALTLLVFRC